MNMQTELQAEFDRLADQAPSDHDVRRRVGERIAERARRRRTGALLAAAIAVVVLAGGIGIARAALSHRSAGPAGPSPVVLVPDVPLPPGTQLIRHQLAAISTPVTAAPPWGLTGQTWSAYPGRLSVSWYGGSPQAVGSTAYSPADGQDRTATAGYVVTDAPSDRLTLTDAAGTSTPTVQRRAIVVGNHPATLETAPVGTLDALGFPADERISWQLGDGRWIHVWAVGPTRDSSPSTALQEFAVSITENPQTLYRSVGIGLTLPGRTVDSSSSYQPVVSSVAGSVALCPVGVDPLSSTPDPTTECLVAAVVRMSIDELDVPLPTSIAVGDSVAHVDAATGRAVVELGNGLAAAVSAPGAGLSAADLAALAASVRLSPSVIVPPAPTLGTGADSGQGSSAWGPATLASSVPAVASAVTSTSILPATTAPLAPSSVPADALPPSTTP